MWLTFSDFYFSTVFITKRKGKQKQPRCHSHSNRTSFVFLLMWYADCILPAFGSFLLSLGVSNSKKKKFQPVWAWNIPLWEKVHQWRTGVDLTHIVAFLLFLHVVFSRCESSTLCDQQQQQAYRNAPYEPKLIVMHRHFH